MKKSLLVVYSFIIAGVTFGQETPLDLSGCWRFSLDRGDVGIQENWPIRQLTETIHLPSTLATQGIGDDVTMETKWVGGVRDQLPWFTEPEYAQYREPGSIKLPFWLQPEKVYMGAAWFQRDIEVPSNWANRRVVLFLERIHWQSRLWVDGQLVGDRLNLSTPHAYDLGRLGPGKHTLTVQVDNRMHVDIGHNSHAISDHTQGNWNGIVGKMELRATPLEWIESLQVYPDLERNTVRVVGVAKCLPNQSSKRELTVTFSGAESGEAVTKKSQPITPGDKGSNFEVLMELPADLPRWSEFTPNLFKVNATLEGQALGAKDAIIGLRDISTKGNQLLINGMPAFLRGTLECAIFPKTGHPPTDLGEWKRIIGVAKAFGLNHLRFHSYCPPEAAFVAADELGMYLQVETCWANQSSRIGNGLPVDAWIYDETDKILEAYGNHPSFLLMAPSNEPGGKNRDSYLSGYVNHYKKADTRRLWTGGSGWPELPENEFHVVSKPRIQAWGEGLRSRINSKPPETASDYREFIAERDVPVISHEIGQWCVYPNFEEIPKYTGYLKAKNFEIFRDRLEINGMGELAKSFLMASGKLQVMCYKEDIESSLRTAKMGGFQLLDLHDFPGQGTALVGVLDPFWEEKGYVSAAEYSRFCNTTVPLARLGKRIFSNDEKLEAEIEVAHFGAEPIKNATVEWKLLDEAGQVISHGELPPQTITIGNGFSMGSIAVELGDVKAPVRLKLVVGIEDSGFENDWNVWVYPKVNTPSSKVLVTSEFDKHAQQQLADGGSVLLTLPGKQVRNFDKEPVKLGFSSIFWNTAWTDRQAPTTLGILCDPKHPALAMFPTEYHSDWQWWYLIHRAGALRLDLLPPETNPVVRLIDDWFTARPLGLVVEGKVGSGKIIICGFDLTRNAEDLVSQQMLGSLVRYLASDLCNPKVEFYPEQIQSLIQTK